MTTESTKYKVWVRFESKRKDGSVVKLRIQDLPKKRIEDYMNFQMTYFIKEEAFHKAAEIAESKEATAEYKALMSTMYEKMPPEISICCLDTDSEEYEDILAASTVSFTSNTSSLDDSIKDIADNFQTKEMIGFFNAVNILIEKFPKSVKEKYEKYYDGRGIIVHPDYRGLGIAGQFLKQRRMLCTEKNVPMTCAWMTSIGSQKAAERDGWETVSEVTPQEMSDASGLDFENDVPIYKLMLALGNC